MAVTGADERFSERDSSRDAEGHRTHVRSWVVYTDDANDSSLDVLDQAPIPSLYSGFPDDPWALVIRRTARQSEESQTIWIVTLDYSTRLPHASADITAEGGSGGSSGSPSDGAADDPSNRKPEFEYSVVKYQEALERDQTGARIVNAAGEPFDPPLTVERALLCLEVSRDTIVPITPQNLSTYVGTINNAPFLGYQAEEVLVDDMRASTRWDRGWQWKLRARFVFNQKFVVNGTVISGGWNKKLVNMGTMQKDSVGKVRRIILPDGQPAHKPVLLNADGTYTAGLTTANYLTFQTLIKQDFTFLKTLLFS